MIYSEPYSVRWHDTGMDRAVRPSSIAVCFQEMANRQFTCADRMLDQIRDEDGVGFLLSRITFRYYEPLYAYDPLDVQTWTVASRGYCYRRCFRALRNGQAVATAASEWALVRIADRKLMRTDEFPLLFGDEPELSVEIPTKVRIPARIPMTETVLRTVTRSDADYNGHMNNTRYPDLMLDAVPNAACAALRGLSISYLQEAPVGETLHLFCSAPERVNEQGQEVENGPWQRYFVRAARADGNVCTEAALYLDATPA